ncbi:stress protein [Psychrobacillus phage PVJ1]|nr:stress protein [Psychrobacillus phage PVJ1]
MLSKLSKAIVVLMLVVGIVSFSGNSASAATKVMWGKTELKLGQIGKATILSDTTLVKLESNGTLSNVRKMKKGEEYRVYSYKSNNGGLYGVGGGSYIQKSAKVKYETPSKSKLALLQQGSAKENVSLTTEDVIQQFKDDGLEVGGTSDLENREFGNTRKEGKRILIPSLGEDAGGRLFLFKNEKDLAQAKSYYDELGNAGAIFYSHTHQKGNFLLQMNGDMSDADFKKYADSLDSIE